MSYEIFLEEIMAQIKEQISQSVSLSIQKIEKNNQVQLDGLIIKDPQINISPTFYLNYFYEDYLSGATLEEIADTIISSYQRKKKDKDMDIVFFTDFEQVKHRIIYKLISKKENEALLEHVPHRIYLDFAVVYLCLLEEHLELEETATILIRDHHLTLWDREIRDLEFWAAQNTPNLMPYDLKSMKDVLGELMDITMGPEDEPGLCPMYVLSNERKLNGATCLLYPKLLDEFSQKMDSDLWVIPSSIHEVILIPATAGQVRSELNDMITDVNRTQVSAEEILSDHVYFYERQLGQLAV